MDKSVPKDKTDTDYDKIIEERANHVFDVMSQRTSPGEMEMLHKAFELARIDSMSCLMR